MTNDRNSEKISNGNTSITMLDYAMRNHTRMQDALLQASSVAQTYENLNRNLSAQNQIVTTVAGQVDWLSNTFNKVGRSIASFEESTQISNIQVPSDILIPMSASLNKFKGPAIEDIKRMAGISNYENFYSVYESLNKINSPAIEDIKRIAEISNYENFYKVFETLNRAIPNIAELASTIDLETIVPTVEDIEKAYEIAQSKDIESVVRDEVKKGFGKRLLRVVVMLLSFFTNIIDGTLIVIECLEYINTEFIPRLESVVDSDYQKKIEPIKYNIAKINDEIKEKIPQYTLKFIGIVIKQGLKVHKKKRRDSEITGRLDSPVAVHVLKKNRKWTYISYIDPADGSLLEGWTLTRYVKKVN